MTDDEAFIRAIVDHPGDHLPRMVYADWLEDHSDPRARYLRAERDAVRNGDSSKLKELAAGLDPIWVARVSRPPIGVCCDPVRFSERSSVIDRRSISAYEVEVVHREAKYSGHAESLFDGLPTDYVWEWGEFPQVATSLSDFFYRVTPYHEHSSISS